jgi:hypothetical protein
MPSWITCPTGSVGSAMMRRRMVSLLVWMPMRSVTRTPSLPPVARPMSLPHLEESCSHTSRRGNKRGQTLGKDFSWTGRHIAEKFPHSEQDLYWLPSTGKIGQSALIATVNTGGGRATHRTMRGRLRGKQRDTQHSFLARACGHLKARREGKQGNDRHLSRPVGVFLTRKYDVP